jgi:hypothetical protein
MKRIKINFAVLAFVLGTVVALTQSSFTSVKQANSRITAVQYHFEGNSLSQDKSASNYTILSSPASDCTEANVMPCVITVDGDLQTWLDARTNVQIRDQADDTKD